MQFETINNTKESLARRSTENILFSPLCSKNAHLRMERAKGWQGAVLKNEAKNGERTSSLPFQKSNTNAQTVEKNCLKTCPPPVKNKPPKPNS